MMPSPLGGGRMLPSPQGGVRNRSPHEGKVRSAQDEEDFLAALLAVAPHDVVPGREAHLAGM